MKIMKFALIIALAFAITACDKTPSPNPPKPGQEVLTDEEMLDTLQRAHFNYMWAGAEPNSGLAYERIHMDDDYGYDDPTIITTGGSGFGIAGLVVAMHRGFIARTDGVARLQRIVNFLARANRFHGVWPHWLYPSGRVAPFSPKDDGADLVESAFLMQGLLCARQYMDSTVENEKQVIDGINALWRGMEFDWFQRNGQDVLYWHWSPNYGWDMNMKLEGYNECMVVYLLAASSPTHAVPASCYHKGWARNGGIRSDAAPYGYKLQLKHNGAEATGGPLFWAHYSWFGLCPIGLKDQYADYGEAMKAHTMSNFAYCVANPKGYPNYSDSCWGLTAGYSVNGYEAHAPNNDRGVITFTAALSSFPYAPDQAMAAARYWYRRKALLWGDYGFYDGYSVAAKWYPRRYLAIDQLTIAPMIENYRSGLLWRLFMSCPEIQEGLRKLDITYTPQ